jgi:hypothetical protein
MVGGNAGAQSGRGLRRGLAGIRLCFQAWDAGGYFLMASAASDTCVSTCFEAWHAGGYFLAAA